MHRTSFLSEPLDQWQPRLAVEFTRAGAPRQAEYLVDVLSSTKPITPTNPRVIFWYSGRVRSRLARRFRTGVPARQQLLWRVMVIGLCLAAVAAAVLGRLLQPTLQRSG